MPKLAAPRPAALRGWQTIRLLARGGMGEVWLAKGPMANMSSRLR